LLLAPPPAATYDLSFCGKVWALRPGPYGRTLALCWQEGKDAQLVDVVRGAANAWTLPDTANAWPHDFALGPAPLALTGAGDRLLAVYVAPLCLAGCGPLQRYVVFPGDYQEPEEGTQQAAPAKPVLAHLQVGGGHQHHNHGQQQPAAAAAADPAAQEPGQQEPISPEEEQKEEEEDEKADEEADKEAEKAEEEKEEEEKKQEVVAALTSKLSKVKDQVAHPSDPAAAKAAQANSFETVYNQQGAGRQGHGLGTLLAVGLVCALLGGFIAMFAYNTMQKYVSGDKGPSTTVTGIMGGPSASRYLAVPVSTGRHHRGGSASSIQDALAEQEMMERTMLLSNGHNGTQNGHRAHPSLPR
jgi:peptidylamidoglycolate lyase